MGLLREACICASGRGSATGARRRGVALGGPTNNWDDRYDRAIGSSRHGEGKRVSEQRRVFVSGVWGYGGESSGHHHFYKY